MCEISAATPVAGLIGYATIIMQIDGRLAATNRVGIEIPTASGERNTYGWNMKEQRGRREARERRGCLYFNTLTRRAKYLRCSVEEEVVARRGDDDDRV